MKQIIIALLVLFSIASCTNKDATPTANTTTKAPGDASTMRLKMKLWMDTKQTNVLGLMDNTYQRRGLLPSVTPYIDSCVADVDTLFRREGSDRLGDTVVLNYTSPTRIYSNSLVDWVFVVARNANGTIAQTRSGFIQSDGDIVGTDGVTTITFTAVEGSYFIEVWHKGALKIKTASAIAFSTAIGLKELDFTDGSVALQSDGQDPMIKSNGYYRLISGDANGDAAVDALDAIDYESQKTNVAQYGLTADFNLDGIVNSLDYAIWYANNGYFTTF